MSGPLHPNIAVIAGLINKITIVMMMGPNKTIKLQKPQKMWRKADKKVRSLILQLLSDPAQINIIDLTIYANLANQVLT